MDQAEYDQLINKFMTSLPPAIHGDHRISLKNRLKYGNGHSLRKRLTDLLNRLPENARNEIAGNVKTFIAAVTDTRNYYTHYDIESKNGALKGKEVLVAAERLRILIVANLLHDLGIGGDRLLQILKRNSEFVHWMNQKLVAQEIPS